MSFQSILSVDLFGTGLDDLLLTTLDSVDILTLDVDSSVDALTAKLECIQEIRQLELAVQEMKRQQQQQQQQLHFNLSHPSPTTTDPVQSPATFPSSQLEGEQNPRPSPPTNQESEPTLSENEPTADNINV